MHCMSLPQWPLPSLFLHTPLPTRVHYQITALKPSDVAVLLVHRPWWMSWLGLGSRCGTVTRWTTWHAYVDVQMSAVFFLGEHLFPPYHHLHHSIWHVHRDPTTAVTQKQNGNRSSSDGYQKEDPQKLQRQHSCIQVCQKFLIHMLYSW